MKLADGKTRQIRYLATTSYWSHEGKPIPAAVRLGNLGFQADRPQTANAGQGRVVGKTFLGSRMAMQIAVGDKGDALLKAYVDAEIGQSVGSDPIWIGWEADSMAVLND